MRGGGGPFSRRRHGRDHECHLSRTLRRDRHSLRSRLWDRHRLGFCICCHARHLESSSTGANEVISTVRMAAVAPLFFTVGPIKGYIRRTPKQFLPKLAPASPILHRRPNIRLRGRPRLHSDRDRDGVAFAHSTWRRAKPRHRLANPLPRGLRRQRFEKLLVLVPSIPTSQTRGFHTWGEKIA